MEELGYDAKIYVALNAGGEEMPENAAKIVECVDYSREALESYPGMPSRLVARYQSHPDHDLSTEAIILAAREPTH